MASCFWYVQLTKVVVSLFALASSSTVLGAKASIGRHVVVGDGTVRHKVEEEGLGDDEFLWHPSLHLAWRR